MIKLSLLKWPFAFLLIAAHLFGTRGKPSSCKLERRSSAAVFFFLCGEKMASPLSFSNDSAKDLFSESTVKVEPMPQSASQEALEDGRNLRAEKEWLEVTTEKADRGMD